MAALAFAIRRSEAVRYSPTGTASNSMRYRSSLRSRASSARWRRRSASPRTVAKRTSEDTGAVPVISTAGMLIPRVRASRSRDAQPFRRSGRR